MANSSAKFNVGGVMLPVPFKIRRLGHFGFNLDNLNAGIDFYTRLLGFRVVDEIDLSKVPGIGEKMKNSPDPRIIFTNYGGDHHAMVLAHRSLGAAFGDAPADDITSNQITWQLGTLQEVVKAAEFLRAKEIKIERVGRDMPGSNWHVYFQDPDGHTIELYYGIEQIGWDRVAKPASMYYRGFNEQPPTPQMNEEDEVREAATRGIDLTSGYHIHDPLPPKYNVGGVMLGRPFKITRIGPVALFVNDLGRSEAFFTESLGFIKTEEVTHKGHRGVYLRNGTEHHSLALFPKQLRGALGLDAHSSVMSFGIEVGSYEQLVEGVRFLKEQGVRFTDKIPPDLYPGIDYAAHALDPEGHCLQLYYYMEQIGWDGKPRPSELRRKVGAEWPAALEPLSDTYADQTFPGPLG
ncbi:MAG TPA: VOC family protein [Candidatus Binataceae bacterium]|nr:VOC family protein [Candidatus Binataceae bacterium]